MKDFAQILYSDESHDLSSDDEIDNLFCQLEQIEPPPSLVDSILASVRLLSHTQMQSVTELVDWDEMDGLVVHHEYLQPS
jgi:hypothetical protein